MAQGLMSGFAQGYGLVSNIQDRKRRLDLEDQRHEDTQQYRADQLAQQAAELKYQHERDAVGDKRWQQKFDSNKQQLAMQRRRLDIAARNADLAAQEHEMKVAALKREQDEARNYRYLTAAGVELKSNGVTPRFRQLAKAGGVPVDRMIDPSWQQAKDTLVSYLNSPGAPWDKTKIINASGKLLQDRVNRVVGTKTNDGRTIVRAKLNNIVPAPDGKSVALGLKLYAKDDKGNISSYDAPVTSLRGTGDAHVQQIPIDQLVGYVKGLDVLDKALPKDQLMSVIHQQEILNGGTKDGDYTISNGYLLNKKTGKHEKLPTIGDPTKRASKAVDLANKELQSRIGSFTAPGGLTKDESNALSEGKMTPDEAEAIKRRRQNQWLNERVNYYKDRLKPATPVSDPAPDLLAALKKNGGSIQATKGQYAGKTIRLLPDGSVVAQ